MSHDTMSSMSSSTTSPATMRMQMTFFPSTLTPLFSDSWTPSTSSQYGATCFFLIILSILFRLLVVGKVALEGRWRRIESRRRPIVVQGRGVGMGRYEDESVKKRTVVSEERSGEGDVVEEKRKWEGKGRRVPPWRLSTDLPRAGYVTVLAGVGYLLMLAVMTMNVGYFLSVLGGIFAGELFVGRYIEGLAHDHR